MEKRVLDSNLIELQRAIKLLKDYFEKELAKSLSLMRITAPLFVSSESGLNDGLSGSERAISFTAKSLPMNMEIVQSLAKWKRYALMKYHFQVGEGIYTDMNAIRKDETIDPIHSLYVDQWDWEKIITVEDRKLSYLKKVVKKIYKALYKTERHINAIYSDLTEKLPKDIFFISSKDLLNLYPSLSSKERENKITKEHGAVFIYQIGAKLKNGLPHDSRAADYDDWKLNGDILVYDDILGQALELSSMGIRVNKDSLVRQLKIHQEEYKLDNQYCQAILHDELPLTIGGGIGQSRLCMFFLDKKHIGEVQCSLWDENDVKSLKKKGINIL